MKIQNYFSVFISLILGVSNLYGQACETEKPLPLFPLTTTLCEELASEIPLITLTNSNSLQLTVSQYSNITINISGTFTINTPDFTFNNCNIKMEPGAEIVVNSGSHLFIERSRLFSCIQMWKGIVVESEGMIDITRSKVQDAENAIKSNGAQRIIVNNNIFNRNYISLNLINQWPAWSNPDARYEIAANQINCTSALNGPYMGQTPIPGEISYIGIKATNGYLRIGKRSGGPNIFKLQQIGVLSQNSYLDLLNCTFERIIRTNNNTPFETGIGVLAVEDSYLVHNGKGPTTTTFSQCDESCIQSIGSTLIVNNNRMSIDGKYGIRAKNTNEHFTTIARNKLIHPVTNFANIACISVRKSNFNSDLIFRNDITINGVSPGSGTGINVNDGVNSTGYILVSENTIEMDNGFIGLDIHPGGANNVEIRDNVVNGDYCFMLANCFYSTGQQISYRRNNFSGKSLYGLYVEPSPGVLVCENNFNQSTVGLIFNDDNQDAVVRGNVFGDHEVGLGLSGAMATIGAQEHHGNRWTGEYSNMAALNAGTFPLISRFEVNTNQDPQYYPNSNGTPSVVPANNWFIQTPGITENLCEVIQPLLTNWDASILDGSFAQQVNNHEVMIWNAENNFYRKIKNNSELDNAATTVFVQSKAGTPISKLFDIQELIKNAHTPESSFQTSWEQLSTELNIKLEEYSLLQDEFENSMSNSSLLTILEQNVQEVNQIKNAMGVLQENLEENENLLLQQATILNDGITSSFAPVINEKLINDIWLSRLLDSEFGLSESQLLDLKLLAVQCPEVAGQAVYRAISLLPDCERRNYYQPGATCTPTNRKMLPQEEFNQSTENLDFKIFPNPAKNQVRIDGFMPKMEYQIEIYTTQGKLIILEQKNSPTGIYSLNTEILSPGTYLLKISISGQTPQNKLLYIYR